jgi:hypothetical protein
MDKSIVLQMTYPSYDIKSLTNPHLNFLRFYAGKFIHSISNILNFLHIQRIRSGFVAGINKHLEKVYLISQGLSKKIDDIDLSACNREDALKLHADSEVALHEFLHEYSKFEEIGFFNSDRTRRYTNDILNTLFEIESKLRFKIYSNSGSFPGDSELVNIASNISNRALISQ